MKNALKILILAYVVLFQAPFTSANQPGLPLKVVVGTIQQVEQRNEFIKISLHLKKDQEQQFVQFSPAELKDNPPIDMNLLKPGAILKAAGSKETRSIPSILYADQVFVYQPLKVSGKRTSQVEIERCNELGGTVRRAGLLGYDHCIQPMPDAGQSCKDRSECLANCIADKNINNLELGSETTGFCEATDEVFGCKAFVENGKYEGTLCID